MNEDTKIKKTFWMEKSPIGFYVFVPNEYRDNKEVMIEAIRNGSNSTVGPLRFASDRLKDDEEVVFEAVKVHGYNLQVSSERLKNKRDFVMKCVEENIFSLRFVSEELKNDKGVVITAVEKNGYQLKYAAEKLRDDRDVSLAAVRKEGRALEHVSKRLQGDKALVLEAVKQEGRGLRYASKELKDDEEVVFEAATCKFSGLSLRLASERLRSDPKFVQSIVAKVGYALQVVSEEVKNDKKVVTSAVKQSGLALEFASSEIRNDKDVVFEALLQDSTSIRYVGDVILNSSTFLKDLKSLEGDAEALYEKYQEISNRGNTKSFTLDGWESSLLEKMLYKGSSSRIVPGRIFRIKKEIKQMLENEKESIETWRRVLDESNIEDFTFLRFLGEGCYGRSYLFRSENSSKYLFVAKMYQPYFGKKKMEELRKKDSLYIPYHENVVSILGHRDSVCLDTRDLPDYEEYWKPQYIDVFDTSVIFMKFHMVQLEEFLSGDGWCKLSVLPLTETLVIMDGILKGITHLNNNGIVHRDLHFGNIFTNPQCGRIWIGDFGCALDLRKNSTGFVVKKNDDILFSLTCLGGSFFSEIKVGGYPTCVAPELVDAIEDPNAVYFDYGKSDLYSVGVIWKVVAGGVISNSSFGFLRISYNEGCYQGKVNWGSLLNELVNKTMEPDPKIRFSYAEANRELEKVITLVELEQERKGKEAL